MGLPSKRRTRRSKRERAAHFALQAITTAACPKCHTMILPHRACPNCGTYRGRQVVNVEKRSARKNRKSKKLK